MKRPTVAKLNEELENVRMEAGDVFVSSFVLWDWEQIAGEIERYDRYGEMIKAELTHSFDPDKRQYQLIIWHRRLRNLDERLQLEHRGYYADSKHRHIVIFPGNGTILSVASASVLCPR
jgi:hypothetical protein